MSYIDAAACALVLLVESQRWIRRRCVPDHSSQRPHPHGHVHLLLCLAPYERDLVEVGPDHVSDDPVRCDECAGTLPHVHLVPELPIQDHKCVSVLHRLAVDAVCALLCDELCYEG